MIKVLAIIGSGHLGQQIAHYAISDNHFDEVVFFDDYNKDAYVNGYKILGTTNNILIEYQKGNFTQLVVGIGYKHMNIRKDFFEKYRNVIPFATIIHSSCWVDKTATIEPGCVIYPGCSIEPNAVIKHNVILNVSCSVAHDSVIGSHSFLSPRVAIAGFVKTDECCILGINSIIIDNISICDNVQLGAGTVVISNINKKGLYVANPHRFIR
ncbi:acetyltransferase [Flavobacterium haoranii]|uniref:Sugar O-acyltransferase, sialic acid O-acetyltransferase NeuD family n=1 Tax=Flavobacterium haoranii TaxID=683124 RepID=A0A1M6CM20_9FLAO|nr:acetyltransferase [Flavobacterium haoranii]SHI62056.1 sugar O-acyltransferase, sialic acid O-acetyltransferase NeuD family [Flavobacterium haoranii]